LPSDALILGFDTSVAHCAAALVSGDRVLVETQEEMARGQAERLVPLLNEVMAQAGAAWSDLSAIGVGIGPGNFTGIRISVAAARGLSLGLDVPALGISIFEARAHGLPRPVTVIDDARRGMVYLQRFAPDGAAPLLCNLDDVVCDTPIIGTAAELLGVVPVVQDMPLAVAIARIAATRLDRPHPRPAPLYLRGADAAPASGAVPALLV
jgi:tRNA threonylcarbamoyl adenosine modification protein YeaZ